MPKCVCVTVCVTELVWSCTVACACVLLHMQACLCSPPGTLAHGCMRVMCVFKVGETLDALILL